MPRRLLLINPVNPDIAGLSLTSSTSFPPLGLGIVAALTPPSWEIEIIDENIRPFEFKDTDLIGLSAFTSSVNRAYEIAGFYRERGIPTVLGGIHASMLPEEAQRYVDSVVIGEAEGLWPRVIADFESGRLQRLYSGARPGLEKIPKPRYDLFDPSYIHGCVQTSRGCPMDCEFCSVTAFNGHAYRQRPIEDILDELESISQKEIFFVDDNIIGYSGESTNRAIELFKAMIEQKIRKQWICTASINFADNEEMLKFAAKSGCRVVFLGLESETRDGLESLNKRLNVSRGVGVYEEAFRRINSHGIAVAGTFIYGIDTDTLERLRSRSRYIIGCGVDIVQKTFLTPLPGTRLFKAAKSQGRLLYANFPTDWSRYSMREVVYKPAAMEPEELKAVMAEATRRIYSLRTMLAKFIKTLFATGSLITAVWALLGNIGYRRVALTKRRY